jgi:hypothetical protein
LGMTGTHYRIQPNNASIDDAFQYRAVTPTFAPNDRVVNEALDQIIQTIAQALKYPRLFFLVKGDADQRAIVNSPTS